MLPNTQCKICSNQNLTQQTWYLQLFHVWSVFSIGVILYSVCSPTWVGGLYISKQVKLPTSQQSSILHETRGKKEKKKKKPAEVKSSCLTSEKEFLPIQLQISCIEKKQAINCYPILLSPSNKTPKPSDSGQMSSNHTVTEIQFYLKCLNWAGFVKWNIHVINEIQFHNIPFKTLW